jgi:recombination protein RecT
MSKLDTALATGKAPSREVTAYEKFRMQIGQLRNDIAGLTGAQNVDKFVRVCLNAVQANPGVLNADRRSLLLSCLRAAQDGLLPDGREAVLNVFKTKQGEQYVEKVQYMPMAYGLVQKIYEAGATSVDAVAVKERDVFEYERGDSPKIKHVPYQGTDDPGDVVSAYAIVKLKTGDIKREVMFRRDIETVRSKSRARDGMMWKDFYDQAAIKSVIHRIVKQLPRSESLDAAIASDNLATGIDAVPVAGSGASLEQLLDHVDAPPPPPPPPPGRVVVEGVVPPPPAPPPSASAPERAPMPREHGTSERAARYIAAFHASTDPDVLDIKRDEANGLTWSDADRASIDAAYLERRAALRN